MNEKILRIGIICWGDCGLTSMLGNTLVRTGCQVSFFQYDEKFDHTLDVIIAFGPFGSLVPVANQLLTIAPLQRPLFVLWMTEQFPNPSLPEWVRFWGGSIRTQIERLAFRQQRSGEWQIDPRLRWVTTIANRFRYYGDLFWLKRKDILTTLVITSQWTADFLSARRFDPILVYVGASPDWGADLGLERDIPVLWLGKVGSRRRERLLKNIREELRKRGVEILMIDGVENPYTFGKKRTILLNRTKIVLNILREKWDDNAMRYFLAAPNRSLIVTEPTLPHTPFLPGVHLVEAPLGQMADTICYYLSHEEERKQIADQAYQLVTSDLTNKKAVSQILEHVDR